MSLIDDIKRSRANGSGAKGLPKNGLHYCSRCGKRGRSRESVERHVLDLHGGDGKALKEPTRTKLMAALLAADALADAISKYAILEEEAADAGDSGNMDAVEALYASAFDEWAKMEAALVAYREATS